MIECQCVLYKTKGNRIKGGFTTRPASSCNHNPVYHPIYKGVTDFDVILKEEELILDSPRFSVGDIVWVKTKSQFKRNFTVVEGFPEDEFSGFLVDTKKGFLPSMNDHCGKKFKVSTVTFDGTYRLEGSPYSFDADMLIGPVDKTYKEV